MVDFCRFKLTYVLVNQPTIMYKANRLIEFDKSTQESFCVCDWANIDFVIFPLSQIGFMRSFVWCLLAVLPIAWWPLILKNSLNFIWFYNRKFKWSLVSSKARHSQTRVCGFRLIYRSSWYQWLLFLWTINKIIFMGWNILMWFMGYCNYDLLILIE